MTCQGCNKGCPIKCVRVLKLGNCYRNKTWVKKASHHKKHHKKQTFNYQCNCNYNKFLIY